MKKSINTETNNIKKREDVPVGETGTPKLGDPTGSSADEITPTQTIGTSLSRSYVSLWRNSLRVCCLGALRERRQPLNFQCHKTSPLYS